MTTIAPALEALARGEVIGLPTDTVYGIGAAINSRQGVEALFELKGRGEEKPIPVLVASLSDARGVGMVDAEAAVHWPGALTVVVRRMPSVPSWVGDPDAGTVAIRIPDHPVALDLLERSGPLAVTSANRSGEPPALDDAAARASLGDAVAVYVPGNSPGGSASTVVDLTGPTPVVLRPGPVVWET